MISDASPKAPPLLALTYGVRQLPGTADPLTYRFGSDVGLRNIPANKQFFCNFESKNLR